MRRRNLVSDPSVSADIPAKQRHDTVSDPPPTPPPGGASNVGNEPVLQPDSTSRSKSPIESTCRSTRRPALSWQAAFAILLIARTLSAVFNIIHDCDEVYNYWEPLHFLLYGYGKQTWEYRCGEKHLLPVGLTDMLQLWLVVLKGRVLPLLPSLETMCTTPPVQT